jgi:hypothetical protein
MMRRFALSRSLRMLVAVVALGTMLPASSLAIAAEAAIPAEKNPPGDIPDSQVFIDFKSPAGFSMKVPEGWSRTGTATVATFADKHDSIEVGIGASAAAPTIASVEANEAKALQASDRAVKITSIKAAKLDGGDAVIIAYSANSAPNAVTNKQIRLERARYLIFKAGKLVTLDMAAPLGADNVDQWALMSKSVRIN